MQLGNIQPLSSLLVLHTLPKTLNEHTAKGELCPHKVKPSWLDGTMVSMLFAVSSGCSGQSVTGNSFALKKQEKCLEFNT